jgi:hypothetical protein
MVEDTTFETKWELARPHLSPARIPVQAIRGAAEDLDTLLAIELLPPDAEVEDVDLVVALRQPVSTAVVVHDLCRLLGVEPPELVTEALS